MNKSTDTKKWANIGLWALFWHLIVSTILGGVMPEGNKLEMAHQLILPLTDLIPNVKRYAQKSIDPIFAETFIGYSLTIAAVVLGIVILRLPAKKGKIFFKRRERFFAVFGFTAFCMGLVCIFWFGPVNPASEGRAYFIIQAATSSYAGIVIAMNSLLVSLPLMCFAFIFIVVRGTSTHIVNQA